MQVPILLQKRQRGNFFCGGSTTSAQSVTKKVGARLLGHVTRTCMFGGKQPGAANGKDEYSLGCGLCRNYKDR